MYCIRIEPVYSQGVGHFELVTNNIEYVELFRNELHRYKEYIKNDDSENLECWEFYEYVYKLVDYNQSINKFKGFCVWSKIYLGDFKKKPLSKKILNQNPKQTSIFEEFEYNKPVQLDYVYNYIGIEKKPIPINHFDIIGKNNLK